MSAIAGVIVLGLTFGSAGGSAPDLLQQLPALPAPAAQAVSARPAALSISGQVEPRSRTSIVAKAYLPVVELPCKEGDRVSKGDPKTNTPATVLARLDDADLQAALRVAEIRRDAQAADMEAARARLAAQGTHLATTKLNVEEAERHWSRTQQLMASNDTSAAAADEARFAYERAKNTYEAALQEHQASKAAFAAMQQNMKATDIDVERSRRALAAATITAPIDGTVVRVHIRVGEIAGNPVGVLMEIADLDNLVLVGRAEEQALPQLAVDKPVTVRLNGCGDAPFRGTIERIALSATEDRYGKAYFPVVIRLENSGRMIRAGVTGEARLEPAGDSAAQSAAEDAAAGR